MTEDKKPNRSSKCHSFSTCHDEMDEEISAFPERKRKRNLEGT